LIFHLFPSFFSLTPSPPQFESLDPALHDAFEAYLRERGVDGALAGFVPRYALWKEQRVSAVCVLSLVLEHGRVNGTMAWRARKEEGSGALIWCDDVVRASDEASSDLLCSVLFSRGGVGRNVDSMLTTLRRNTSSGCTAWRGSLRREMREEGAGFVRPGAGAAQDASRLRLVRRRGRACGRKAEQEGKGIKTTNLDRRYDTNCIFSCAPTLILFYPILLLTRRTLF
jgi:hypothetical protein